jgi:hypothetical protein
MTLPSGIDESKISAEVDNGMMEITVRGGAATAEPHRIEVKEGTIYRLSSRPSSLTRGER